MGGELLLDIHITYELSLISGATEVRQEELIHSLKHEEMRRFGYYLCVFY